MKSGPTRTSAPRESQAEGLLPGSYFHDAWVIDAAEAALSPFGQFLRVAQHTPRWIEALMVLRNRVVNVVGLKNLGEMSQIEVDKPESAYLPGQRVGIFTLISKSPTEVLLGDKDKHLDVVVSVHKSQEHANGRARITVTTVVHVHNWLGRLYMLPVTPMHRVIVRNLVRTMGNAA